MASSSRTRAASTKRAAFYDNAVRLDPSFVAAQQKGQETKSSVAGSERDRERRSSRACAARPKVRGDGAATTTYANSRRLRRAVADGLNPSIAAVRRRAAALATTTQPAKDPSSGTGGDNPREDGQGDDRDPTAEAA